MEPSNGPPHNWESYYARTAALPKPEMTAGFLNHIPANGHILDFGAGSGRWAAAFLRDRADIALDALDQNIDQATLLPEALPGEKIKSSFQEFKPSRAYDGIWAFATLFFMNKDDMGECFHKLASALKEGGVMSFSMVDDCHAAESVRFHGLSEAGIRDMLKTEGLDLVKLELNPQAAYGPNKITIPTYSVMARKSG